MKLLFATGGTGGHINPALAIAGEIRLRQPDADITFVGTPNGMESRLVPAEEFMDALSCGMVEVWDLAEHFDVTEDFIRKAVEIYKIKSII